MKYLINFSKEGEANIYPLMNKTFEVTKEDFERLFFLFENCKRGEIKE
jgi:hypothetical protein